MRVALKAAAMLLVLTALAAVTSGCHPPRKVMFKQEFVEGMSVKHIKDPVTEEYILEICKYKDNGEHESCSQSTILVEKEKENLL